MIELRVEDYCQECKAFSPVTEIRESKDRLNPFNGRIEPGNVNIIIRCDYNKRCAGIARHIRNELTKESEI